jgi:hypothetical protein
MLIAGSDQRLLWSRSGVVAIARHFDFTDGTQPIATLWRSLIIEAAKNVAARC